AGRAGTTVVVGNTGDTVVSNDIVFLRAADGQVWVWNQATWTFSGGWLPSLVAGDGQVFGIGYDGQLWRYRAGAGWTASGGYGVQIDVANDGDTQPGNDIVFLRGADSRVWMWTGTSWGFTGGW